MIEDVRKYDFCVVGSGPSSYALVNGLLRRDPKLKIGVLEAGIGKFSQSALGNRESVGQSFKLDPTINIGFGGTSQLWHNVLAPLDQCDFENQYIDSRGDWLVSLDALHEFYRLAAGHFSFQYDIFYEPEKYFSYKEQLAKIDFDREIFQPKVFVHPKSYLRTDVAFQQLQEQFPRVEILLGIEVSRFEECDGSVTVTGCRGNEGKCVQIKCNRLILCAGALNNPPIIDESVGSGCLPMLGKCLMDHPMGNMYQFKYTTSKDAPLFSSARLDRDFNVKVALRPTSIAREQFGLPNSAFYLRPCFSEGPDDKTEDLKLKLLTVRKKLFRGQVPVREALQLAKDINLIRQIIQYKTGLSGAHTISDCMLVTEQIPNTQSCIKMCDGAETTEFGPVVNWRLHESDLEHVRSLGNLIEQYVVQPNQASLTYPLSRVDWKQRLSSAAHHLGTVRMGRNMDTGCVDKNLRIHGLAKVYVCDGSVFPTSGNANPTLTCMALAERLSEHLVHG